jgi:hypothetical protein
MMVIIIKSRQFLFLHFGTKVLHEATITDCVPNCCHYLSPSLSHCSIFLLYHTPPALFWSSTILCPWVFQFKTYLSVVEESFRSLRQIHFHFRSLISAATHFSCTRLHSTSLEIRPGQRILKVSLRNLFIDVCRSFVILGPTFHAFYPYNRTNVTLLSKILNFVTMDTSPQDKVE